MGYNSVAGILAALAFVISTNFGMYIGRGFRDETILVFPAIIVLTSLILNRFYFILFSSFTILNVVVLGFFEMNGIFIHDLSGYTTFDEIISATLIMTATAVIVYTLNKNILDVTQRASQSEFQFRVDKLEQTSTFELTLHDDDVSRQNSGFAHRVVAHLQRVSAGRGQQGL